MSLVKRVKQINKLPLNEFIRLFKSGNLYVEVRDNYLRLDESEASDRFEQSIAKNVNEWIKQAYTKYCETKYPKFNTKLFDKYK